RPARPLAEPLPPCCSARGREKHVKAIGARRPKPLFAALAGSLLACARHARADVPGVEIGFVPGVGVYPHDGPNPLALGLGGRVGATLGPFYAGLSVTYYFGSQGIDSSFLVSKHTLLYGVTAGFEVAKADIGSLRIQLGFGADTANTHGDQSDSSVDIP